MFGRGRNGGFDQARGGHHGGRGHRGGRRGNRGRGRYPDRGYGEQRGGNRRFDDGSLLMATDDATQPQGRSSERQIRRIAYKRLEDMVENKTPYDIVIMLAGKTSGLEQLLREDERRIDNGMTQMLLKVLGKMSESDGPTESLTHVLQMIIRYDFHQKIISFIYGLLMEENPGNRRRAGVHLNNVCKLLILLMNVIPSTSRKEVSMTIVILRTVIGGLDNLDDDVNENFDLVQKMSENMKEKAKIKVEKKSRTAINDDLHSRAPPSDFREIPVFPQLADIHGTNELFLRTNLVDKAYNDVNHYLDVQFRLLREDFIRPLREGIAEIMHQDQYNKKGKKKTHFDNVKVYSDVTVQFMKPEQRGILHRIRFNAEGMQRIKWSNTKRLLYGNLLCLSSDHFKANVHFAVVADRKPDELEDGFLTVEFVQEEEEQEEDLLDDEEEDEFDQFLGDSDDEFGAAAHRPRPRVRRVRTNTGIDMKKIYTMVETDAYFEAYRHVLAGLKATEEIPLERYIVRCEPDMHAPEYLRPSVTGTTVCYDFSSIVEGGVSSKNVPVLYSHMWPSPQKLGLDTIQAEALQLALTSELAIIQGPPGTGKTHVGLIIMKVLLKNKSAWNKDINRFVRQEGKQQCPILVVCYTNHALDQFLEGIAKFSSSEQTIVRVGGRCSNEITKDFSLREIRKKKRQTRVKSDKNAATRKAIWELNDSMRKIQQRLQANCNKLEASLHCIQRLRELESSIPGHLYKQFLQGLDQWKQNERQSEDDILLEWLGLTGEERFDFGQYAIENMPGMILQIVKGFGHSDEDIGRAFHNIGSAQPIELHQWIITQKRAANIRPAEGAGAAMSENVTIDDEEDDEDYGIMGEANLLQQQRLLDTDEFQLTQSRKNTRQGKSKQENEHEVKELINRMAIATFEDHGEEENDNKEQNEGWQQTKGSKKKNKKKIKHELGKTTTMDYMEILRVRNIYDLSQEDRWKLYRTWANSWRDQFRVVSGKDIKDYNGSARRLDELRKREDAEILQSADVVAVTTTGAAKYRELIYKLNCKIVVIEEAAEVLEAHIITSMPKTTKHLILIGDHQQLKPSPTVYELAIKYNLETSLFERLISKIPHVTLSQQHRMRPAIADLLRPRIYKSLTDHESVHNREDITGIRKPLFFISHSVLEESVADGRSKKNQHEADFLVALCKYIIMQGYEPEQITILAMYTGQLFAFRNTLSKELTKGVRVTAVDNFQGEENDIILLSLVRSNEEQKIGFLSISNRICVALSRARSALYCIGNMTLLSGKSPLWRKMVDHLREKNSIGESLELQCKHHPDKIALVKCSQDFAKVPEGGCGQPCNARLDCGHTCTRPCHPDDHSKYLCQKACDKIICAEGHKCKKKCFAECGPCSTPMTVVIPKCGHQQRLPCSQSLDTVRCNTKMTVRLECGHTAKTSCYQSEKPTLIMCKEKCSTYLDCGHSCKGSCSDCFQGRLHLPCNDKCDRTLVCEHACKSTCDSCPPCNENCKTRCEHSKCTKKCGEPCTLCREKCEWKCRHFVCTKLCSEPCDRPPCNKACKKNLIRCGHPCIGLCGEPCPSLCRICNEKEVTEIFFGDEDETDAKFVQLKECGHIFTYDGLDTWMNLKEEGNAIKMKGCPRCKTPIWKSRRYGRIINKLLTSVNEVKAKTSGNRLEAKRSRDALKTEIEKEIQLKARNPTFHMEKERITIELKNTLVPHKLVLIEEKYRRLQKLSKLKEATDKLKLKPALNLKTLRRLKDITQNVGAILKWVMLPREKSTEHEENSFQLETDKIKDSLRFIDMESKYLLKSESIIEILKPYFTTLERLLFSSIEPYDEEKKNRSERYFRRILRQSSDLLSNLGITDEEKKMICSAMGFAGKGHWYKCPKGHVYCITECGGATETSICPECKSKIGGTSHRLLEGNRVASEMDGATGPAYDPTNQYIPAVLLANLRRQGYQ